MTHIHISTPHTYIHTSSHLSQPRGLTRYLMYALSRNAPGQAKARPKLGLGCPPQHPDVACAHLRARHLNTSPVCQNEFLRAAHMRGSGCGFLYAWGWVWSKVGSVATSGVHLLGVMTRERVYKRCACAQVAVALGRERGVGEGGGGGAVLGNNVTRVALTGAT